MIDFFIFLCGLCAGVCITSALAASGYKEREREAYDEGKQEGFIEGLQYRKELVHEEFNDQK